MTAEALDVADAPPTVWFAHWLRAGSVLIVLFVHQPTTVIHPAPP